MRNLNMHKEMWACIVRKYSSMYMSILNALRLEMIMIFCSDSWSAHIFLYLSTDPQIRIVSTVHYIGKGVCSTVHYIGEGGRPPSLHTLFVCVFWSTCVVQCSGHSYKARGGDGVGVSNKGGLRAYVWCQKSSYICTKSL